MKKIFTELPAFKFKFTVTLEYLEVRLKKDWRPRDLQLIWRRGQRQREFNVEKESLTFKSQVIDDVECDIASASWEMPKSTTLLVTLYKTADHSPTFRKKEYVFSLEDNRGLTTRKLAVFPLNIAEYASLDHCSHPLEMEFRTLSIKTTMVTAGIHIQCQYIKKGISTDDDMISNFSHVSDDEEEYRRMTLSIDETIGKTVISCPVQQPKSNSDIIKSRAQQTKSQLMLDLSIVDTNNLSSLKVPGSPSLDLPNAKEGDTIPSINDACTQNDTNSNVQLRTHEESRTRYKEVKERRRLSALNDNNVNVKEDAVDRRTSKGNIFTTLRSGMKAVFQGRKGSAANESESSDVFLEGVKLASSPGYQNTASASDDFCSRTESDESTKLTRKILELEARNQELFTQYRDLEQENGTLRRDVGELQTEVSELQLLVEDLQNRLVQAEASKPSSSSEKDKLFEKMNLRGWLCKRGVKGGPLGKRWQRRWFSMDARGYLYYYKRSNNEVPRGFIALDLILAVEDVFPTVQDKNNASFNVITDGRTYELMAHDQEEKEKWINALDFIRSWRSQLANISL